MTFEKSKFLIICGQEKAGTTSLFTWLSAHPDVCPSMYKEARFFLDQNYPLASALRYNGNNLIEYQKLFNCKGDRVFLEASPAYLYSDTALKIAELLPNAKVVVVLREPIERLFSAYRYFKQIGEIPVSLSFYDYISKQIDKKVTPETPVFYRVLQQCLVDEYLVKFEKVFGDRFKMIDFNDLKHNPMAVVKEICNFSGLRSNFYEDFEFSANNKTAIARFPVVARIYYRTRRRVAFWLVNYPKLKTCFRPLSRFLRRSLLTEVSGASARPDQASIELATAYLSRHGKGVYPTVAVMSVSRPFK